MAEPRAYTRVLVDAGPLVAIFRQPDRQHNLCVATLREIVPPLLTSWPALTEAAYLLRDSSHAIERLLAGPVEGLFRILPLEESELPAMHSLLRKYRRLQLQLADASLVYLAHREGIRTIFTLDRRDFTVIRGPGNRPFRLLPDIRS